MKKFKLDDKEMDGFCVLKISFLSFSSFALNTWLLIDCYFVLPQHNEYHDMHKTQLLDIRHHEISS